MRWRRFESLSGVQKMDECGGQRGVSNASHGKHGRWKVMGYVHHACLGEGDVMREWKRNSLGYSRIVLDFGGGGLDEIHTGLLVEGAALGDVVSVHGILMGAVKVVVARRRVGVNDFGDELGLLLLLLLRVVFCAGAGELDELDAGRAYGVRPVERTLGLGDTAGNLVEEVGGGDGAVKRSDEVRWERVEGLKKKPVRRAHITRGQGGMTDSGEKEDLVLLPVKVHLVGIGGVPAGGAGALGDGGLEVEV